MLPFTCRESIYYLRKKITVGKIQESPERDKGGKIRKELKIGAKAEKKGTFSSVWQWPRDSGMYLKVYELREGFYLCISSSQKRLLPRRIQLRPSCIGLSLLFHSLFFQLLMKNIKAPKL